MRYTIKHGDTLWGLARRYGITVDELLRLNPHIKDRNKIYAGRSLELPDVPPSQAGQASSPVINKKTTPAGTGIPAPQKLPITPPMFPNMPPALENPVAEDARMAAQGMDPGAMDPTQIPFLANPTSLAILANIAPKALPQAGRVVMGPLSSNIMPMRGSRGVANMLLSQTVPQSAKETALFGPMTWRELIYGKYPSLDPHGEIRRMLREGM